MITANEWTARFSPVEGACRAALEKLAPAELLGAIDREGGFPRVFEVLGRITALRHPEMHLVDEFRAQLGFAPQVADEIGFAHTLLLAASLHGISLAPSLPVSDSVKNLLAEEFLSYAAPSEYWRSHFRFSDVRFQEMGRIATLQRFPAGQFHWELAAFPRSWLPQIARQWTAALRVFAPMRGFGPLFELHLNDRRKNRVMLLESEMNLSCYRAAQSLALQPEIRGIMTISWLYCRSTGSVTPHLAWLRQYFLRIGAAILDVREAPSDAGFLTGSSERRKLYEAGTYRPKESCVIWPRRRVLQWMEQHPEFDR